MIGLGQAVSFFGTLFHWNASGDPYSCTKYLFIATLVLAWALTVKPKHGLLTVVSLIYMAVLIAVSIIAFKPVCFIGKKLNYFTGVLPSFLVFACYHYSIGDNWRKIANAFVAACCITSLVAIAQHFGFYMPQGDFFSGRVYAMLGSPVFLSGVLAMAIPLCLGSRYSVITIPLIATAILLTQSRSGILAASIGVFGYYYARSIIGIKGLAILSLITLGILAGMFAGIRDTSQSDRGRYQMMRMAGKSIADNPFFGVGPERFGWVMLKYRDEELNSKTSSHFSNAYTHNHLVEALVAGGPLFLIAHLLLIGTIGLFAYRCATPPVFGACLALCAFGLMQPTPLIAKAVLASILGGLDPTDRPFPRTPMLFMALLAFFAATSAVTMAKIYKTAIGLGLGEMAVESYDHLPGSVGEN